MKKVDFYFDFASPNAYLSHKVIKNIKEIKSQHTLVFLEVLVVFGKY